GVVVQADPVARPPDLRVGEAEPYAEPQRVGKEHEQQHRPRQHEEEAEGVAAVLELLEHGTATGKRTLKPCNTAPRASQPARPLPSATSGRWRPPRPCRQR